MSSRSYTGDGVCLCSCEIFTIMDSLMSHRLVLLPPQKHPLWWWLSWWWCDDVIMMIMTMMLTMMMWWCDDVMMWWCVDVMIRFSELNVLWLEISTRSESKIHMLVFCHFKVLENNDGGENQKQVGWRTWLMMMMVVQDEDGDDDDDGGPWWFWMMMMMVQDGFGCL